MVCTIEIKNGQLWLRSPWKLKVPSMHTEYYHVNRKSHLVIGRMTASICASLIGFVASHHLDITSRGTKSISHCRWITSSRIRNHPPSSTLTNHSYSIHCQAWATKAPRTARRRMRSWSASEGDLAKKMGKLASCSRKQRKTHEGHILWEGPFDGNRSKQREIQCRDELRVVKDVDYLRCSPGGEREKLNVAMEEGALPSSR